MIVVGAKGHASEVLEILVSQNVQNIAFFDDVNDPSDLNKTLEYDILRSLEEVRNFFVEVDNFDFVLGLGVPIHRELMAKKFIAIGGNLMTVISNSSVIGKNLVIIGKGTQIMNQAVLTTKINIGSGVLINAHSSIMHDSIIEDYVEIAPGVRLLGRCKISKRVQLGANSVVLPDIVIGENTIVGAGAVVTKNLPANVVAVGIPAKIIKYIGNV